MILFKEEISIAKNLNEFINIACTALQNTLNSEVGQELVQKLLNKKLAENPNMTKNEWNKTKQEFMTVMFFTLVKEKSGNYVRNGKAYIRRT